MSPVNGGLDVASRLNPQVCRARVPLGEGVGAAGVGGVSTGDGSGR